MAACHWMLIRGCWRCIDGVSPNRKHILCDATNGPFATVQDLMDGVGKGWSFPTYPGGGFAPPDQVASLIGADGLGPGPLLLRDRADGSTVAVTPGEYVAAWNQPAPSLSVGGLPGEQVSGFPGGPAEGAPIGPGTPMPETALPAPAPPSGPVQIPEPAAAVVFVVALVALCLARWRSSRP